ncbi:MAG TPA: membrane protein insertase YidC [Pseudonocardiaceae bacterium]|nr:membrane protein insertase YidC [Pseudonocardiaceae bacterium]
MFDFIYYIVSFILWCWHQVFGFLLGPTNFFGWALSIILLVFTLRLVLLKPAVHQIRAMRKMQKVAPEMKKIQKKYANDRQRQAQEMQKFQKEQGVNPLSGCLPLVLQIPVFLGLNHVLRSFRPGTTEVYFFKAADVHSYLNAKLFDAHLGDAVLGVGSLGGTPGWHWGVAPVAIPLMIAASIATHFTARLSVQRQQAMGNVTSQTAIMNKVTLYLFPLGVLVFGGGFPVGLLLYWLSNNAWTLGQQHFVFRKMDREEEAQKEAALQNRQSLAPKPGQKPVQKRRGATPAKSGEPVEDAVPEIVEDAVPEVVEDAKPASTAPKPGAKPKRTNDPRRAVKPTVPNPNGAKSTNGKPTVRATNRNGTATTGAKNQSRANGAAKQDGTSTAAASTNGRTAAASEIPGLISDRSRRKKQNRKRG